jgi:hypothetical protein
VAPTPRTHPRVPADGPSVRLNSGESPRPSPNRASSSASVSACRAARSPASFRRPASVRFASFDAFAPIFVPSSATTPAFPIPSRAHSTRTSANRAAAVPANCCRNRATVAWSGPSPAQITRNATSCPHSRSIRRDDVTPFAYAQTSSVTSMSGSYRRSAAGRGTPRCPAGPPPRSPARPGATPGATRACPAGEGTADPGQPGGTP